jgi:uncharacterized Zn-finger protein
MAAGIARGPLLSASAMTQNRDAFTPEIVYSDTHRVACDGASDIRGGAAYKPAALGHPRVWLEIDEKGYVDCGYCDRRFVLKGGAAERGLREVDAGDLPAPGDASVA